MKKYLLASEISDGRVDNILKLLHQIKYSPSEALLIDWSRVKIILPAGPAILACLFDSIVEKQKKVRHIYLKKFQQHPVVEHLLQVQAYKRLPDPSIVNALHGKMILEGNTNQLSLNFPQKACDSCGIKNKDLQFAVKLVLNELMINAIDHGSSERYYMYAGRWKNEIHAGVLDMGVTIPAKLEQKYPYRDDKESLEQSLKEGVTTRRSRVGGLGLHHTFDLLKNMGGRLTIISRQAQLRRYFNRKAVALTELKYPLSGTWCFVRFPLFFKKI